jgi:hypothetical protein
MGFGDREVVVLKVYDQFSMISLESISRKDYSLRILSPNFPGGAYSSSSIILLLVSWLLISLIPSPIISSFISRMVSSFSSPSLSSVELLRPTLSFRLNSLLRSSV